MKLSIITPYYQTLSYTKKLAEVLEPQLTDEVEWIIVDDGCFEFELEKMKARVIHIPYNSGNASRPRNIGLDCALGEYICFIDSDDLVAPNYVSRILEEIEKGFDYCYYSWRYGETDIIIEDEPPEWNACVWNCVYHKDLIGSNRFDVNINIGEDLEFNKIKKGKKRNIKDVLYYYNWDREGSLVSRYANGYIEAYRVDN